MIAVIGRILGITVRDGGVAGLAGRIAMAAASRGASVELVGKLGDDPAGDATLFALSRANVGHAAILRDATRPTPTWEPAPASNTSAAADAGAGDPGADDDNTEWLADLEGEGERLAEIDRATLPVGLELSSGDLELALRYLTELSVIVLADPAAPGLVPAVIDGAGYAGAALVILGDPEVLLAAGAPADATILSIPAGDPDGAFASLVAEYAVALDAGKPAAEAWSAATGRLGAERT